MGLYEPVEGDRVRVVMEGEVTWTSSESGRFTLEGSNTVFPDAEHVVSIEKLEPPVVTFGPGSVVEATEFPGYYYTVGENGYYSHQMNEWSKGGVDHFSSDDFRLVWSKP